eukprot:6175504-Pleurochrysis_carterae.AAC.1
MASANGTRGVGGRMTTVGGQKSGGVGSLPERVLPGVASKREPLGSTLSASSSQQWVARLASSHPTEVGGE